MKICFVISDFKTEGCGTSLVLMKKAHEKGHELYVTEVGDFNFHSNAPVSIYCKKIPKGFKAKKNEDFLAKIQDESLKLKEVKVSGIDVMFLRNNPTEEAAGRHWAEQAGIAFGRLAQQQGVLVLNDSYTLSHAFIDKLYFEELPEHIKPKSLITRSKEDLLKFWEEVGKKMVLKPLEGSGGQNVYMIDKEKKNFNQIFDTLCEQGYIIAQEFLPDVKDGDVRVILMNGRILEENGEYAIIRRVSTDKDEFRSNMALGAKAEKAELTPEIEHIVEVTAPKLIRDGLFFVGLDVVKDKLIEINVLSPGALEYAPKIGLPTFTDKVIDSIERKVEYRKYYGSTLSNKALATME